MKSLLREPLIHFLGGAVLIFLFFAVTGWNEEAADYEIRLGQSDIDRLALNWAQATRRPPNAEELRALVAQHIRDEIYYREAQQLGLDQDDPVVKRRLVQKLEFTQDSAGDAEPSDAELQKWLDDHPAKYALSNRYDFEHIYLGRITPKQSAELSATLKGLNAGRIKADTLRQNISLPRRLTDISENSAARQFGAAFAAALGQQVVGEWAGPVSSGFGQHLIRISRKQAGEPAALDNVRQALTNDWRAARREEARKDQLDTYLRQYNVIVAGKKWEG